MTDDLHPDVRAMLEAGELHPFDAEWIARLKWENQPAAAEKCVKGGLTGEFFGRPVIRGAGKVYE